MKERVGEILEVGLVVLKSVVIICVSYSWVVIHLHTIGYMGTLELSPEALRFGVIVMGVSALSLPLYLVVRSFKKG